MGVRFSQTPCPRSKTDRPCILKHKSGTPIGDGIVRHIWGCRRCGQLTYDNVSVEDVECALSHSGLHKWYAIQTLSFKQHYRYREIIERQSCECCGAIRDYEYQSMIGYSPHRKKS